MKYDTPFVEWYLPALHILYIIFPLLFLFIKKISRYFIVECLLLFIILYGCVLVSYYVMPLFPLRLCVFILGIFSYLHKDDCHRMISLIVLSLVYALMTQHYMMIVSMTVPSILFLSGNFIDSLPMKNLISVIGKYSLEIYLAQMIVTKYLFRDFFFVNHYFMWSISVPLIIIIAWGFSKVQMSIVSLMK